MDEFPMLRRLGAALADRYTIDRELGSGGMATVYLAEDLKHHRQVAIKVLDPVLAAVVGAERFLREIEIAASLTHPHILPIFDSGEADGLLFCVLPYVEGESLRQRLEREKQLPVKDAVRITQEIADALSYAHEQGVVHRDVKPGNVLLEAGHAVLADFGIAQAVSREGAPRLTMTGVTVGSPAYMSPEQAAGEQDLDGRSDQYSLGCVLYEMLAGRPPFMGPTAESVARQHVITEPTPVGEVRATVPDVVAAALMRTLAKPPADRFGTTYAFAAALTAEGRLPAVAGRLGRAKAVIFGTTFVLALAAAATIASLWPAGQPSLPEDRVVVFPFENHTGELELDNLGRMVASWITRGLDRPEEIHPVSAELVERTLQARGGEATSQEVARDLGAGTMVTGGIWLRGDSLELRAEIVSVETGEVVRTVEGRGLAEAPTGAVEEIRDRVMGALPVSLGLPGSYYVKGSTPTYEAYEEYLRGTERFYDGDHAGALHYFQEAYQLDTTFVLALVGAVHRHESLGQAVQADSLNRILRSRWAELSPDERFWIEKSEKDLVGDRIGALRVAQDAFGRDHDDIWGYVVAGSALTVGRPELALGTLEQIDFDDPRMQLPFVWARPADAYHYAGRYREELDAARAGRERFPESLELLRAEMRALVPLGEPSEIASLLQVAEGMPGGFNWSAGGVLLGVSAELARHGYMGEARAVAEQAIQWYESQDPAQYLGARADALMFADRPAEALELLRAAGAADSEGLGTRGRYGMALAQSGDRSAAELVARWFEQLNLPYLRGQHTYVRAAIAAKLGQRDEAVRLLAQAMREGMSVWNRHSDAYFSALWGYEPFEQLVGPGG